MNRLVELTERECGEVDGGCSLGEAIEELIKKLNQSCIPSRND